MVLTIIILAWLGLSFGSFLNALTWRIHKKKDWVRGRSQCEHCNHKLASSDLVPLFSWLLLRGRCRYCKKPISWQHPAVELATAAVFVFSYVLWPAGDVQGGGEWTLFITWLLSAVGLLALLVYDARWMLLPNKLIYPTLTVAVTGRFIYTIGSAPDTWQAFLQWALAVMVASGVFWALFMISKGRWIGYGDVRLGLITGTLLATPAKSFLMLFLASILGLLFVLPGLINSKKSLTTRLPYGPFLISATFIVFLFGGDIIDWYKRVFLP